MLKEFNGKININNKHSNNIVINGKQVIKIQIGSKVSNIAQSFPKNTAFPRNINIMVGKW